MKKIMIIFIVAAFSAASLYAGDKPCVTKKFKTDLAKAACADGGQKAAKKAWKKWQKAAKKASDGKVKNCKTCHKKLSPKYPLKNEKEALDLFKKFGGK